MAVMGTVKKKQLHGHCKEPVQKQRAYILEGVVAVVVVEPHSGNPGSIEIIWWYLLGSGLGNKDGKKRTCNGPALTHREGRKFSPLK